MTNTTGAYPDTLHNADGTHRAEAPEVVDPNVFGELIRRHQTEHRDRDEYAYDLYRRLAAVLTELAQRGENIKIVNEDLQTLTLPDGTPVTIGSDAAYILQGPTGGISYYKTLRAWDFGNRIYGLPRTATVTEAHLQALMGARGAFSALYLDYRADGNLALWDENLSSPEKRCEVLLRYNELVAIYNEGAGQDDFDAVAAAQKIIDEVLAKDNS